MDVLGITAFHSSSAACLVRKGRLVAAARESMFSGRPDDRSYPAQAVEFCLRTAKIGPVQLGAVAFAGDLQAACPDDVPYSASVAGGTSLRRRLRRLVGGRDSIDERLAAELDPGVRRQSVSLEEARGLMTQADLEETDGTSAIAAAWVASDAAPPAELDLAVGPGYNVAQIRTFLRSQSAEAEELARDDPGPRAAEDLLAGRTLAWFDGRIDFGPDTSASRSFLRLAREGESPDGWRPAPGPTGDRRAYRALLESLASRGAPPLLWKPLAAPGRPAAASPREAWSAWEAENAADPLLLGVFRVSRRFP